jgi:hypothetical protein
MVNKLATVRQKKDRATEDYSESVRAAVTELRREHPMWSLQTIGNTIGVSRERVRQLLKGEGMPTAAVKALPIVELTCNHCGATFERLQRLHTSNQERGSRATYCGASCQRQGLAKLLRERAAAVTECRNHHPLTPENTLWFTRKHPSRGAISMRRCKRCRSEYSKRYYWQKKAEGADNDNSCE